MTSGTHLDDVDDFGGDYPGSNNNSGRPGDKRTFGDLDDEENDLFGSKKGKLKVEESGPGAATGMILSLRESLQNCKDDIATCQIVTDNGANFKAAGGHLMRRFPTLYWTPCAAHCLDLMLEDIGKLKEFRPSITHGRGITTFVYRHGRLLSSMREKTDGRDLVRSGTTRFATAFLTLQSLYKNRDALRKLFGGEDWYQSRLSTTTAGGKVHDVVLSMRFWNNVEDCIRSSQPLLVALRIVDGDEKPAMAEITAAMDFAKSKIKNALEKKPRLLKKVLNIIERRWESQMEVDLYGAALFLNPGKFFQIKENDVAYSSRLRMKFNDVLEKMVLDTNLVEKISDQADQYENSRNAFGKQLTIRQRSSKNPLDWWGAFGGLTIDLTMFAKRILGLCCSSSGCERNWSTFEFVELEATRSEIQKWHSAFQNGPATPGDATPDPGLVLTYLQNLKSSEESLKEKLEKSKKKEAAFIVAYAKREQEIADLKSAIQDLKKQLQPVSVQTRRFLLDPAIHEEFARLKNLVEEKDKKVKELQDNVAAVNFCPSSKMGRSLMNRCRELQKENEEIGARASEAKIHELAMEISSLKSQNTELRNQFDALYQQMDGLTDDVERSNEMVFILEEELEIKEYEIERVKAELRRTKEMLIEKESASKESSPGSVNETTDDKEAAESVDGEEVAESSDVHEAGMEETTCDIEN